MTLRHVILVLMVFGFAALASAQDGIEVEDNLLVFVGQKISYDTEDALPHAKEYDVGKAAEDQQREDYQLQVVDDLYETKRYKVLRVLAGDYKDDTISFLKFYHGHFYHIAEGEHAVVFVRKEKAGDGWKYLNLSRVFPVKGGGFASCDDFDIFSKGPGDELVKRRSLQPFDFSPAVTRNLVEAEVFFPAPVYEIKGDIATCRMGAPAEDVFRVFYLRYVLPSRLKEECKAEFDVSEAGLVPDTHDRREEWLESCTLDKRRAYHAEHPELAE